MRPIWSAATALVMAMVLVPASAQQTGKSEEERRKAAEERAQAARERAQERAKQAQARVRSAQEHSQVIIHRAAGSYLGVGVADIDADRAKELKLPEIRGVEVKSVEEDSPAAKAGIKEGDVILEYNGQRIEGTEQLIRLVHETPANREVKLSLSRNGVVQTLTANIGARTSRIMARRGDGEGFEVTIPPIPPIPPIPDFPHGMVSWRSSMLGVESESLNAQLAEFFGVKEGVLVRSVIKNSAAEKAGMKAGDVIVRVDDKKVSSPREISGALRDARGKKTIPVVVVRDKREMPLTVTLEDSSRYRGADPARAASGPRFC